MQVPTRDRTGVRVNAGEVAVGAPYSDRAAALGDGYRIEARVVLFDLPDVVRVPLSALFRDGDAWSVYALTGASVTSTRVTIGRRNQRYLPPSCDITVHVLGDARTEWVLAVNRARFAGDGYASTEMEIWDGNCEHLVAYATQQMFFVFPDGPPPPEERVPFTG